MIAVINQKGGVGKTTTCVNLAHALAISGLKVLAVDMDPQGHLTTHFGLSGQNQFGVGDLLIEQPLQKEWVLDARERLMVLPSGDNLRYAEAGAYSQKAETNLGKYLEKLGSEFDFVMIDCPPASGTLIEYTLGIVKEIMVPVSGDYLALRGLSDLMITVNRHKSSKSRQFTQWLVLTRYHKNRKLSAEVRSKLLDYFPDQLLSTSIRETTVLAESAGFGKTVFEYKRGSLGMQDYARLANDFINRRFAS